MWLQQNVAQCFTYIHIYVCIFHTLDLPLINHKLLFFFFLVEYATLPYFYVKKYKNKNKNNNNSASPIDASGYLRLTSCSCSGFVASQLQQFQLISIMFAPHYPCNKTITNNKAKEIRCGGRRFWCANNGAYSIR